MKLPQFVSKTTSLAVGALVVGAFSSVSLAVGASAGVQPLAVVASVLSSPPQPREDEQGSEQGQRAQRILSCKVDFFGTRGPSGR